MIIYLFQKNDITKKTKNMTEEQIKQNAKKCARLLLMPFQAPTDEYKGRYEGFIAGAHSRDEEIEKYKSRILELQRKLIELGEF